jgi:hypothetical protein
MASRARHPHAPAVFAGAVDEHARSFAQQLSAAGVSYSKLE